VSQELLLKPRVLSPANRQVTRLAEGIQLLINGETGLVSD